MFHHFKISTQEEKIELCPCVQKRMTINKNQTNHSSKTIKTLEFSAE